MRIRKHFSNDSLQTTADKFGLKVHTSVLQWVNKFGGEFRSLDINSPPDKEKSVLPDSPKAMLLRIKLLEETLEHKKLENLALSKMIDIARARA